MGKVRLNFSSFLCKLVFQSDFAFCMIPYSTKVAARNKEKEKMNKRVRRARVKSEHGIGNLKEEYKVCGQGIECHDIAEASRTIVICTALHNFTLIHTRTEESQNWVSNS